MFKTSNINFGKVCECDQALVKFYHFYGKEISSLERDYKLSLSRVNKILQSGFHKDLRCMVTQLTMDHPSYKF